MVERAVPASNPSMCPFFDRCYLAGIAELGIGTSVLPVSDDDDAGGVVARALADPAASAPCKGPNVLCPYILSRVLKESFW